MELKLDVEGLGRLLRSFHGISGLRMGVFQPDGHCVFVYPEPECEFCARVKSDPRFVARCHQNDSAAFRRAMDGGMWIYRCHAGLCEAVIPILCDGRPTACLMIGQAAPAEQTEGALRERMGGHPDFEAILRAFAAMPRHTEKELADCAQIMAACAGYIYLNSMVSPMRANLSARLQAYIQTCYARPASLSEMAAALGVSVTRLCTTVRAECGATPHALLTAYRMKQAERLLTQTALPVREVAAAVGIADYNYFSRVFRKATGKSPSAFRKEGPKC